jgi:excisionase family DNA binding protein
MDFEERLLTTKEVSKWLGIASRTLCTWAECNELRAIKVGRQWRFRRADIIQRLQQLPPHEPQNNSPSAAAAASAADNSSRPAL